MSNTSKDPQAAERWSRLLWIIPTAMTLAVHIAFVLESHPHLSFQFPLIDAATYHRQAVAAAAGQPLAPGPFWQPPLYPFLLSLIYRLLSQDYFVVRLLHALPAALTSALTYFAARHVLNKPLSVLAGCLVGLYGPLLFFSSQLLPAVPAATLNIAAIVAALALLKQPAWPRALLTGGLIGLAALTVPNVLVVVPAVLVCTALAHRQQNRPGALGNAAALLTAITLVILPVTIRNWLVSDQWVWISTNGGVNLYIGNNPDTDKSLALRPGVDWDRFVSTPLRTGIARNPAESQQYFVRETLRFARAYPGAFLSGLLTKTRWLLSGPEMPRNLDLYTFREDSRLLRALAWHLGPFGFPLGLAGPLACVGMLLLIRESPGGMLLPLWLLLYSASIILFFPASRYLVPVIPCLLICAVTGARGIARGILCREHRDVKLAALALCLVVVFALPVTRPTDTIDFNAERRLYTGVALQVRGQQAEALAEYDATITLNPRLSDAWFYRGTLLRETGQLDAAMASQLKALDLNSDHYRAMNELAVMLFNRKKTEEAISLLRRSAELDPLNRQTMQNLAVGLLALGQITEANLWRARAGEPPVQDVVPDGKATGTRPQSR